MKKADIMDIEGLDVEKVTKEVVKRMKPMIHEYLIDEFVKRTRKDKDGRLLVKDNQGNESMELIRDSDIGKEVSKRLAIKEAAQMSLQKRTERFVINIPEWMKIKIKEDAKSNGISMNEVVRKSLAEYFSR